MLPADADVAAQLRHQIYYMLDNDLVQNALFLAGRLHGQDPRGADAAHLLALCHLRLGKLKSAFDYAREKGARGQHLGCAYVFAQACLGLERYNEGLGALDRARGTWCARSNWGKHTETSRVQFPDTAAVYCLMGKLAKGLGDVNRAVDCSVEALKLNPFMWDAFVDLCDSGASIRTANVFQISPEISALMSESSSNGSREQQSASNGPSLPNISNGHQVFATPGNDPFQPSLRPADIGLNVGGSNLLSRLNGSIPHFNTNGKVPELETPSGYGAANDEDVMMGDAVGSTLASHGAEPPHAPLRRPRTLKAMSADVPTEAPRMPSMTARSKWRQGSEPPEGEAPRAAPVPSQNHKRTISGHVAQSSSSANGDITAAQPRRSVRLFNQIRPTSTKASTASSQDPDARDRRELRKARATGTKGRSGTTSTVGRVVSGNRKALDVHDRPSKEIRTASVATGASIPPPTKVIGPPPPQPSREQEALEWLLDLFAKLGNGYYLLSRYQCQPALQAFGSIPISQRETPWVLAQVGKAYYQRGAHSDARDVFARVKQLAPSRMEDNEVYSTVLWHLKAEMDLAYLSHELIEADRLSPQAWCSLGNSFSLQREHDQAVKCFRRATQLDPHFAYAYTLQGHEHLENEEFDKALQSYRSAIATERRHYYGWYGLGKVYEKMEKYEIAEKHYKCAAAINPTNAALAAYIGVVLEKQRKPAAALIQYSRACELDPRSALSRFKKARVLMVLRRPREALVELEILKDIAPDEANVHFMLGRLYKMLRDRTAAIRHFTVALNLDPKAAQYIKEQMESLDDDDDDDFDDDG